MPMIILLFALGAISAWLFEKYFINTVRKEMAEGYERKRKIEEASIVRSFDRNSDSSGSVGENRDGGDGCKVLRIDSRR